ncbi:MAG: PqqD family protein [Nitrospirota bacterium]|nr:PqqD family protein [Nitrospirota bacterium]
MDTNGRLRINTPKIVHETIDGETVILNLDNGNYYSLEGAGAQIWGFIERGAPVHDIIEKVKCDYESNGTDVAGAVNKFVSELRQEGLAVPVTADTNAGFQWPAEKRAPGVNGKKQSFTPPTLNKYSDMQDLLLLDPIHDVDEEAGWPTNKPDPADN